MAYVSISQSLLTDVSGVIRNMRSKEASALGPKPSVNLRHDDPLVSQLLWGEHLPLKSVIPEAWMGAVSYLYVRTHAPYVAATGEAAEPLQIDTSVDFSHGSQPKIPPNTRASRLELEPDNPLIAPLVAWSLQQHEVGKRWQKTEREVLAFLNNCKSLNEALKLWPDIKFYIPEHYINRVNEKVSRSKTEKEPSRALDVLKNMDTDAIVANAVIARMASSGADDE